MEWKKQKETESKFPGCLDINKQFLQEKTLEGKITNGFNCILFRPSYNSHVAHCCTQSKPHKQYLPCSLSSPHTPHALWWHNALKSINKYSPWWQTVICNQAEREKCIAAHILCRKMIASNNYTLWAKTEVRTDHFLYCLLLLLGRWAKCSDQTDIVSQILAVSLLKERSIGLQDVPSNRCCFRLVVWFLIWCILHATKFLSWI